MKLTKDEFGVIVMLYAPTKTDCLDLVHDRCIIIEPEEKCTVMKEQIVCAIARMHN